MADLRKGAPKAQGTFPDADEPGGPGEPTALGVALRAPLAALTLLTILPVPAAAHRRIGAREVAASAPFFPLVGALLGLAIGSVAHVVASQGNLLVGGVTATVLLAVVTGALHLDGLADAADALGARGGSRERRLEIMRDSSTGAYGTAAIAGWFVLMTSLLASLPVEQVPLVLALAAGLGRTAAVLHSALLPPARTGGLGAGFRMDVTSAAAVVFVMALLVAGSTVAPRFDDDALLGDPILGVIHHGWLEHPTTAMLVASVVTATVVLALTTWGARRLVGGRTGDTLGATITLVEVSVLFAALLAGH
ncbi:MAG: adenosylcobinamide-GDP ribazoletransferase [Solirubrobacteraceae bacterium]|nr:adenosylcobinamide-GDP ribazoletransferase [Patulibacter sp.]